jgi:DNA topoisomerase VI subunit B
MADAFNCDHLAIHPAAYAIGGSNSPARLNRSVFTTSRLLEFCSQKELVLQTGHPVEQWPLVILKELVDNSIDAAEETGIAPAIGITVTEGTITVDDNGPGIPPETVKSLLDFTSRTSSREAYASPTRGAQGNALKTLVAMPFALDGTEGETVIEARGVRHRIKFSVDTIRQVPKVEHVQEPSNVKNGTSVTVQWPVSASSNLDSAKSRFLQIAEDYTWLNPHLTLRVNWNGERQEIKATDPAWPKWKPSDPTPAHWYDAQRLKRLAAAYVADDQHRSRDRTVRQFVGEFRGLSGTAKQKSALDRTGAARMALADLFNADSEAKWTQLLSAMKEVTKPVKPQDLGIIGKDHLASRFEAAGADLRTYKYKRILRDDGGVPAVIEVAFGYCPKGPPVRRVIQGVNWSVGIENPFRRLGQYSESLDTYLQEQRVGREEPIVVLVHLASPCITYTDRGKSAVALRGEADKLHAEDKSEPLRSLMEQMLRERSGTSIADDIITALRVVTKDWAKQRKAEEREASARANRDTRPIRASDYYNFKSAAYEVMEGAYLKASANGTLPALARQVMYQARLFIQNKMGGQQLNDQNFCQQLLPNYIEEYGVDWDIVYDDRGHFTEPHTGRSIGLGTISVRNYLANIGEPTLKEPGFSAGSVATRGPNGRFGGVLLIEKEGFLPLLEAVHLAERFDVALASTKGMSSTAARTLVDNLCKQVPLLVLHDFDKAGFSIIGTLRRNTRRYTFSSETNIIDLGLRLADVHDLNLEASAESAFDRGSDSAKLENFRLNGATAEEAVFLLNRRVELNALASDQLVAFIESKLQQHGIKKIVPNEEMLADAYRLFAHSSAVEKIIERELDNIDDDATEVPADLEKRVRDYLVQHPERRWEDAVAAILAEVAS